MYNLHYYHHLHRHLHQHHHKIIHQWWRSCQCWHSHSSKGTFISSPPLPVLPSLLYLKDRVWGARYVESCTDSQKWLIQNISKTFKVSAEIKYESNIIFLQPDSNPFSFRNTTFWRTNKQCRQILSKKASDCQNPPSWRLHQQLRHLRCRYVKQPMYGWWFQKFP